jgi:adenosylcobinamide-GDP ribazoletransferase
VAFLTRAPLPARLRLGAADVARGAPLFALVGAGIGAAAGSAAALVHPRLPALAAAAVALAVELVLTGGLHLDALADTADAVGARTRERALEIMRDPRIGSFGAAALCVDLLARAAAIAALLDRGGAIAALAVAGASGRASSLPLAAWLPYARATGGPGSVLSGRVGRLGASAGVCVAVGLAAALAGTNGLVAAGAAALTAAVLGATYRTWLGGVTGDALGAAAELSGTVALLVAVALH